MLNRKQVGRKALTGNQRYEMIQYQIRPVIPDDAAGIVGVLNPIIADGRYTVLNQRLTIAQERAFIEGFPQRGVFLIAETWDGRILGFQSMEPFASYTSAFDHVGVIGTFVALDQRRQGIGSQLWQALLPLARDQGYEKIFTYVRADNPASLTFYLKAGFGVVGTAQRQAKIGNRYIDEIIIERWL